MTKSALAVTYITASFLLVQIVLVGYVGAEETRRGKEYSSELNFVGKWVREHDGAVMILSPSTYYLKFKYKGGIRENYADIISYDVELGHIAMKISEIHQDGKNIGADDKTSFRLGKKSYMYYEIIGDILKRNNSLVGFPKKTTVGNFIRQ